MIHVDLKTGSLRGLKTGLKSPLSPWGKCRIEKLVFYTPINIYNKRAKKGCIQRVFGCPFEPKNYFSVFQCITIFFHFF